MRCPSCGSEMNRHAEKPLKTVESDDLPYVDITRGEVVADIFYCPACGKVEAVVAPPSTLI